MNSRFRVIRWTSRAGFLALAGALMAGLWVTPRYLSSATDALPFEPSRLPWESADPNALPPDIALPEPADEAAPDPVLPSRLSRDLLPFHFEARSAETLFDELRSEAEPARDDMEPWSQILLGRLLAIDDMVAKHSTYYGTDYLEQLLAFAAESLFDPLAQGPQVDDRGIGQVGYWAEEAGRRWAGDRQSRYYSPDLDPDGSIWDPETNIILATAVMRWIYTSPDVTSPQTAYAVYTRGHEGGLRPGGALGPEAQVRVDRAASYRERVLDFFRLKLGMGEAQHPLTVGILELDRTNEDGEEMYRALRDYYTEIVEDPADPAVAVLLAQEALGYSDLLGRIYSEDVEAEYLRLHTALLALGPAVDALGHAQTQAVYGATLAELEERLGS